MERKIDTLQKHIFFIDFVENYYTSKNSLHMVKNSNFVKEEDKKVVRS